MPTRYYSKATDDEDDELQLIQDEKFRERTQHWVVLVDDEEAIRLSVGDYLYDQGYQVTACADADALLQVCTQPKSQRELPPVPDVIISDIRMPGTNGLELLSLIRANDRLQRVPVVLLTAKALTQDRIAGYQAGANVYLPKPFDPEELLSIVDNLITRKRQTTTNALVELKQDVANIKQLLQNNQANVVQQTNVYLTLAERQVLNLICQGYTNREIAQERGVSVIAVNRMISKLYKVTQTKTRTELYKWAVTTGYVAPR